MIFSLAVLWRVPCVLCAFEAVCLPACFNLLLGFGLDSAFACFDFFFYLVAHCLSLPAFQLPGLSLNLFRLFIKITFCHICLLALCLHSSPFLCSLAPQDLIKSNCNLPQPMWQLLVTHFIKLIFTDTLEMYDWFLLFYVPHRDEVYHQVCGQKINRNSHFH